MQSKFLKNGKRNLIKSNISHWTTIGKRDEIHLFFWSKKLETLQRKPILWAITTKRLFSTRISLWIYRLWEIIIPNQNSDFISIFPTMWNIQSPEQMHDLGKDLAKNHKILLLHGDLWAGKTTLIKGFAEQLGINPQIVQSPTYAYVNIYEDKLLHIDMYRLNSLSEAVQKGILSQITEFEYIVIERPKWISELDLGKYLELEIEKISASERLVRQKI